jgi:hypothetical protein
VKRSNLLWYRTKYPEALLNSLGWWYNQPLVLPKYSLAIFEKELGCFTDNCYFCGYTKPYWQIVFFIYVLFMKVRNSIITSLLFLLMGCLSVVFCHVSGYSGSYVRYFSEVVLCLLPPFLYGLGIIYVIDSIGKKEANVILSIILCVIATVVIFLFYVSSVFAILIGWYFLRECTPQWFFSFHHVYSMLLRYLCFHEANYWTNDRSAAG